MAGLVEVESELVVLATVVEVAVGFEGEVSSVAAADDRAIEVATEDVELPFTSGGSIFRPECQHHVQRAPPKSSVPLAARDMAALMLNVLFVYVRTIELGTDGTARREQDSR